MGKMIKTLWLLGLAALLAACGDNGNFFTSVGTSSAANVSLLVSSPQLGSGSTTGITVTAIVKDSGNLVSEGAPVVFSASSGTMAVTQGTTDASGMATATLTPGSDFTNRTVTVSATTGSVTRSTTVTVTGTSIAIGGETTIVQADTAVLTATLTDSEGSAINGVAMTISSGNGNTLSAASLTTDSQGKVSVTVTGTTAGNDTITFQAAGVTATHSLAVSGDQFQISAPAANIDVALNTNEPITANWQVSGSPQSGMTINFSATRGTLYACPAGTTPATSATTDGAGDACIMIKSTSAGPSTITAWADGGPSATKPINFVATVPATINLQTDKTSIGPNDPGQTNQQATLTATVRDANNNLVKGKTVRFSITQDVSGGSLTSATAVTDSLGKASTTYISSSATTAKDGVVIQAMVDGTAIQNTVSLTVAQSSLFISLGTGNEIIVPNETTYQAPYSVVLTDANGNAVANKDVNISVEPVAYRKGWWEWTGSIWAKKDFNGAFTLAPMPVCSSEDSNLNGILDTGEDNNGNGILDPGNVTSTPVSVTTGADGSAQFNVTYAQQYAQWVEVKLTASRLVAGTEAIATSIFWLPVASTDISSETVPPPGEYSPFGIGNVCTNTL